MSDNAAASDCPNCGLREAVPVIYGPITPEAKEKVKRGEAVFGGPGPAEKPIRSCRNCGYETGHHTGRHRG